MTIQKTPETPKKLEPEVKTINKENSSEIKNNIRELHEKVEKYFVSNIYYEKIGKDNPNLLAEKLLTKELAGKMVIELALNPGILTLEASLKNAMVIGIDKSPLKVVVAENLKHIEYDKFKLIQGMDDLKLPIENLLNCKFKVMDLSNLEFNDGQVDIVFSDGGIKEGEISPILNELKRVLKIDGSLLLKFEINNDLKITDQKDVKTKVDNKLTSNGLILWAESNNMKIVYSKIIYKYSILNLLINLIPVLFKFKYFNKMEKLVIVELQNK